MWLSDIFKYRIYADIQRAVYCMSTRDFSSVCLLQLPLHFDTPTTHTQDLGDSTQHCDAGRLQPARWWNSVQHQQYAYVTHA